MTSAGFLFRTPGSALRRGRPMCLPRFFSKAEGSKFFHGRNKGSSLEIHTRKRIKVKKKCRGEGRCAVPAGDNRSPKTAPEASVRG